MGIRVRKAIGYAIKSPDITTAEQLCYGHNLKNFLSWLTENKEEVIRYGAMEYGGGIFVDFKLEIKILKDIIDRGNYYKAGGSYYSEDLDILLISDPCSMNNYRFDDLIDYYEQGGVPIDRIKWLRHSCGIFPYIRMVRYKAPTKKTQNNHPEIASSKTMSPSDFNMLTGSWDHHGPIADKYLLYELTHNWRPIISPSIWAYVLFCGVNEPVQFVNSLRPAIMTWWS